MRILIDGDSSPVIETAVEQARRNGVECIIISNENRNPKTEIRAQWITVPTVDGGTDREILEMVLDGDVVVTDDVALALKCAEHGATPIKNNGKRYYTGKASLYITRPRRRRLRRLRAMSGQERARVKKIKAELFEIGIGRLVRGVAGRRPATAALKIRERELKNELDKIEKRRYMESPHIPRLRNSSERRKENRERLEKEKREETYKRKPKSKPPLWKKRCVQDAAERREIREMLCEYEQRFQAARRRQLNGLRQEQLLLKREELLLKKQQAEENAYLAAKRQLREEMWRIEVNREREAEEQHSDILVLRNAAIAAAKKGQLHVAEQQYTELRNRLENAGSSNEAALLIEAADSIAKAMVRRMEKEGAGSGINLNKSEKEAYKLKRAVILNGITLSNRTIGQYYRKIKALATNVPVKRAARLNEMLKEIKEGLEHIEKRKIIEIEKRNAVKREIAMRELREDALYAAKTGDRERTAQLLSAAAKLITQTAYPREAAQLSEIADETRESARIITEEYRTRELQPEMREQVYAAFKKAGIIKE
ncbi:MAG: DUF188 domain-containing protein [Oscillospiraceae bacterium]|jgi:uncharacterized protein YaiI (UPF0178 family)|nr:DUF188 domain-containing protein [Oscillospiraceae bacterium]